jgi:hypothetical protein
MRVFNINNGKLNIGEKLGITKPNKIIITWGNGSYNITWGFDVT